MRHVWRPPVRNRQTHPSQPRQPVRPRLPPHRVITHTPVITIPDVVHRHHIPLNLRPRQLRHIRLPHPLMRRCQRQPPPQHHPEHHQPRPHPPHPLPPPPHPRRHHRHHQQNRRRHPQHPHRKIKIQRPHRPNTRHQQHHRRHPSHRQFQHSLHHPPPSTHPPLPRKPLLQPPHPALALPHPPTHAQLLNAAGMAKLVDAPDLGSGTERCAGSSPVPGTIPSHAPRHLRPSANSSLSISRNPSMVPATLRSPLAML